MKLISRHKTASAVLGLAVLAAVSACGPQTTGASASAATASQAASAAADDATAAPAMTAAEQQAVDAAKGYLDLGSGFSKAGLLKQLSSSYGNGFSEKDAEFAVAYLKPDWNAQAVEAAQGYMKLGGFSRSKMIDQLTSSYGSGFTEAQAEYAADKVGL